MQKKQLNVRISCELHKKIEATERSKQSVVSDALELYFDGGSQQEDNAAYVQQLAAKDQQIAELHVMLQTSISNQPKMLPPPPPTCWWKFWQKKP